MSALGASISGLQASQKWLDVISNNISNSNTVAYKDARLNFADLISSSVTAPSGPSNANNLGGVNPSQLGLGVTVGSIQTIMNQGAIQTTGNATDVAINGNGFLTVKQGDSTLYTRAGNLTFDQQGNLVTADGGLVQGWEVTYTRTPNPGPLDLLSANTTITGPQLNTSNPAAVSNIVIPNNMVLAPKATSNVTNPSIKDQGVILKGNLDSKTPMNANAATLYGAVGFIPDATTTFVIHDSLGNAYTILAAFAQSANTGGVPSAQASWNVGFYNITGGQAPSATNFLATPGIVKGIQFNADGSLSTEGSAVAGQTIAAQFIKAEGLNGGALGAGDNMKFDINIGTDATADPNKQGLRDGLTGDYGNGITNSLGIYTPVQTVYNSFTDGYSEGTLTGVSIDQTGGINGSFSNGQIITVAKLAMSTFTNPGGLDKVGGNYYATTANSGLGQIGTAGGNGVGSIQGGALEASNVDLTVELTNMILAQRMFESNARVVTAADSVLQTLTHLGQ